MKPTITYREQTITLDVSGRSSVFGRLIRLITFPVKWVLFGKASI